MPISLQARGALIVWLALRPDGISVSDLCRRFERDERTIQEALASISAVVPLSYDGKSRKWYIESALLRSTDSERGNV